MLRDLIAAAKHRLAATDADLEARSADPATGEVTVAAKQIWRYRTDKSERLRRLPQPAAVAGLARALDEDPLIVLVAMARATGLDVQLSPARGHAAVITARTEGLSDRDVKTVLAVIDQLHGGI